MIFRNLKILCIAFTFFISGSGYAVHETQVIDRIKIQTWLTDYFEQQVPNFIKEITIDFKNIPDSIIVPAGKISADIKTTSSRKYKGNVIFNLFIWIDSRCCKKITSSVKIRTFEELLVVKRNLPQYQQLTKDDVEIKLLETTNMRKQFIQQTDQLENYRTKRFIAANRILTIDKVEPIPVVEKGDIVRLIVDYQHICISTKGKALENGCKNETIEVMNLESKKKLKGKVIKANEVLIRL